MENGSHFGGTEQNGKTNGFTTNGSHKDEDGGDVTMDIQEEADAMKSPSAPKGKSGRRSKADSETKSRVKRVFLNVCQFNICIQRQNRIEHKCNKMVGK